LQQIKSQKLIVMKNNNQLEIILFSAYSLKDIRHKEMVRWLGTIAQSAIGFQQEKAKRFSLKILRDTPPIYLS